MPVNITVEFVQKLLEQNTALMEQNAALTEQVDELNATVRELTQTIRELKEQLNQNSKNSSKPPSSDGLKKPPVNKDRSLRQKSGRKQGAQAGHGRANLSVIAAPDHVEHHMHSDCSSCPYHDSCLEKACIRETRHEIDAEVVVNVTAHELVVVNDCPLHGGMKEGTFPANMYENDFLDEIGELQIQSGIDMEIGTVRQTDLERRIMFCPSASSQGELLKNGL